MTVTYSSDSKHCFGRIKKIIRKSVPSSCFCKILDAFEASVFSLAWILDQIDLEAFTGLPWTVLQHPRRWLAYRRRETHEGRSDGEIFPTLLRQDSDIVHPRFLRDKRDDQVVEPVLVDSLAVRNCGLRFQFHLGL